MSFVSDRILAGVDTQSKRHPGTIGSLPELESIHTSTSPTTRGQTRVDTSPHGVETPTPPADL